MPQPTIEEVARKIKAWRDDPILYVREVFGAEPDEWQADVLRDVASPEPRKRIAMQACVGPGKLQPKSMMLYTPDGMRRWGDLRVGDFVFAQDGTPTRISRVSENGVMQMHRIVFDDQSSTIAGSEHLWKVRGHTGRRYRKFDGKEHSDRSNKYSQNNRKTKMAEGYYSVLTTKQIMESGVRDYRGNRHLEIPVHGAALFEYKLVPIDPYALGVWIGDGCRNGGRYTGIDDEIDNRIRDKGYDVGVGCKITKTIRGISKSLKYLGLLDKYSYQRSIPEIYKTSSVEQRIELLRGLMDTDGCIGKDNHCEYDTTSLKLAEDVVFLVRSLGGKSKIKVTRSPKSYKGKDGKKIICRVCYRVTVTTPFSPFYLTRKSERWSKTQERYLTRFIDRIEDAPSEDSMCIEIEHPSKCYLANDFIVTHNSAVEAWIGLWFLSVQGDEEDDPKGAAISVSSDNLRDTLWSEFSKWMSRSKFLTKAFSWKSERIHSTERAPINKENTWFLSARAWAKRATSEEQGRTLSGFHSGYMLFLLDETGEIPPDVLRAAEQGLSGCKWGRIIQAGNPTSHKGMLYHAAKNEPHRWSIHRITGDPDNPKRSPRVDIEWARDQIAQYGRTNPWVMSQILGEFPPTSIDSLFSPDELAASQKKNLLESDYNWAQKRIGVDVARFGDDATTLVPRQGLRVFPIIEMRGATTNEVASRVASEANKWGAEQICVDTTGGWGAGVVDQLRMSRMPVVEVNFGQKADNPKYFNKRAEMARRASEWVKRGGVIPIDPILVREMVAHTYSFDGGKFRLEEKAQIKKRLNFSPDRFDGMMATFAMEDSPAASASPMQSYVGKVMQSDWDPLDESHR